MHGKRVRVAVRDQMQWRDESLDQLLPPDHPARGVWAFVAGLDLAAFFAPIRVTPHTTGGTATDPRTLLALWVLATLDGVGTGRDLEDLCRHHLGYRWVCGDDPINYHTLNDFRAATRDALDALLTQSVAALCHAGIASLDRVAQDGVRVRAAAGAGSFRREPTLRDHLAAAERRVAELAADADAGGGKARAAQARAAADRVARVTRALDELVTLRAAEAARAASRAKPPEQVRASMTDPEARKMKMPDGGFRPAYNVQFATTTAGGVIAGVDVTSDGTDAHQLVPMVRQLERRYGAVPAEALVDGGFATLDSVAGAAALGVAVYAPLRDEGKQLAAGADPYARKKGDPPAVADWRARMGMPAGKDIYRERGATAEWANAQARNRGLTQFRVRGRAKARVVATWFAVAHNAAVGMAAGVWRP